MVFDWGEYSSLAEQLRSQPDEASKRSAISRLYYSIFHQAQNYLKEKQGFQDSVMGKDSHRRVWEGYLHKGRSFRPIAEEGLRIKNNRQEADYNPEILKLDELVDETFIKAKKILDYLNKLP